MEQRNVVGGNEEVEGQWSIQGGAARTAGNTDGMVQLQHNLISSVHELWGGSGSNNNGSGSDTDSEEEWDVVDLTKRYEQYPAVPSGMPNQRRTEG